MSSSASSPAGPAAVASPAADPQEDSPMQLDSETQRTEDTSSHTDGPASDTTASSSASSSSSAAASSSNAPAASSYSSSSSSSSSSTASPAAGAVAEETPADSDTSAPQLSQPSGGVMLGFGCGMFGLLGSKDEKNQPLPIRLPHFNALVHGVAVGSSHALAVGADGALYSWGDGSQGALGLGDKESRFTPTELPSLQTRRIVSTAAGYAHSFALSSKGEALAFGNGEMAALGLTLRKRPAGTPPDLDVHLKPALVKELSQLTRIIQIACGDAHTLALSSAGRVYSVGDGSRGALGLDLSRSSHVNTKAAASSSAPGTTEGSSSGVRIAVFTEVSSLLPTPIASIAAGAHHSLFVSAAGSVYSSGDSGKGRLGYPAPSTGGNVQWLPRRIQGELENRFVINASAGAQYSLFLTQQYIVFASGSNAHGEGGRNGAVVKQLSEPTQVPGLARILQISAGSTHALARDHLNRVWSWGSSDMGELGRTLPAGAEQNSSEVGLVELPNIFPHQHIVSITAGANVSYIVVGETVLSLLPVCTSKPSSPHRLVARSTSGASASESFALFSDEPVPMQTDVVAPSPSSSASASAPAAASAASSASSASPSTALSLLPLSRQSSSQSTAALVAMPNGPPQYVVRPSSSALSLNAFSYSHFSSLLRKKDWPALSAYVQYIFSSALLLNASFLPKASAGGGSFIDHHLLEIVFQKLLKATLEAPKLQNVLASSIQKLLTSMVQLMKAGGKQPPTDMAAYRAVFIAFQSPHFLSGGMAETAVLTDLAYILTRTPRATAERIAQCIWSAVPLELVRIRFVKILLKNIERRMQQALHGSPINMRLRQSSEDIQDLVYVLSGIHQVVERRQSKAKRGRHHGHGMLLDQDSGRLSPDSDTTIPDTAWQLPNLEKYMDLATDLHNYVRATPTAAQLPVFSFMRFPWMLSPTTKAAYLRTEFDASLQQQAFGAMLFQMSPTMDLKIRRTHLVEDTVNALNKHSVFELRRPLKVQFSSADGAVEVGEDQGGLTAEFFELVFKELFHPRYELWEARREWSTVWFSSLPVDPSKQSLYQIVGMLLGMLLMNGSSASLNWPVWLWAQLLGLEPTLAHLHSLDPQMADSLQQLLDFEGDVENTFCLSFSVDVEDHTPEEHKQLQLLAARASSGGGMYALPSPIAGTSSPIVEAGVATPITAATDFDAMQDDAASAAAASSSSSASASASSSASSTSVAPAVPAVAAPDGALIVAPPRRRMHTVPLLKDGENIPVTQENRAAYVAAYLRWLFTDSVKDALGPLIEGFQAICPVSRERGKGTVSMKMFSPADLELTIVGDKKVDFADLRRGALYEGYAPNHPTINAFWEVVLGGAKDPLALTSKEQRLLLLFTTGSSRAPVGGLSECRLIIQRAGPDTDALPTSSTCYHVLMLPQYATKEKLSAKLKLALANAVGFGLR